MFAFYRAACAYIASNIITQETVKECNYNSVGKMCSTLSETRN